jgi:hypothetical protein
MEPSVDLAVERIDVVSVQIFGLSYNTRYFAYQTDGFDGFFGYVGLPFLDNHRGLFNWSTYFKITMLRHISFNMDYHWVINPLKRNEDSSKRSRKKSPYEIAQETIHPERYFTVLYHSLYNN